MYTITNGPCTAVHLINAVLQAFLLAYIHHQDLVFSPDDMWLVVCLQSAKYVEKNAEKLRSLFVNHNEGKTALRVMESAFSIAENDWTHFFGATKSEIYKKVKGEISEILMTNFTATAEIESVLSEACLMHTFKDYFVHERYLCVCGIRQVHFMGEGTLDDSKLLGVKAQKLKAYCIDGDGNSSHRFTTYIDGILPIFD